MHGRKENRAFLFPALMLLAAAGCGKLSAELPADSARPEIRQPTSFNPARAGTIAGQVTWTGDRPEVAPFRSWVHLTGIGGEKVIRENPNAPRIDSQTGGVGNAVVFLRGVTADQARPWDLPPVRIEQRDYRLHVCQGDTDSTIGFVRRGQPVTMVSRQDTMHLLQARGATFFTLAFADADQPRARRLEQKGLVEFSSGAGYYWMRGYVFVDEHPYYARTDAQGHFALPQVPPGDYEVVCWMPNWRADRQERDPESSLVIRLSFRPPLELSRQATLGMGETQKIDFHISAKSFR